MLVFLRRLSASLFGMRLSLSAAVVAQGGGHSGVFAFSGAAEMCFSTVRCLMLRVLARARFSECVLSPIRDDDDTR